MAGADNAGEDFEVGRTNQSEERSLLVAINGDPDGYQADFVLDVSSEDNMLLRSIPQGVDAVHATGTEAMPTGGAIGTIPAGNGVVGRGLNGIVGYVHGVARSGPEEAAAHAGLLGAGGSQSFGVFGRGLNGMVGYTDTQPRDAAWESQDTTGVCGRAAGIGVRGKGDSGGVQGESDSSFGVEGNSQFGPGVHGTSTDGFGVLGDSESGNGVAGISSGREPAGMFESKRAAQLWLVPTDTGPLNSPSGITPQAIPVADQGPKVLPAKVTEGGQLMAIKDDQGQCTLWFCVKSGPPARWAQVLLGEECDGRA